MLRRDVCKKLEDKPDKKVKMADSLSTYTLEQHLAFQLVYKNPTQIIG